MLADAYEHHRQEKAVHEAHHTFSHFSGECQADKDAMVSDNSLCDRQGGAAGHQLARNSVALAEELEAVERKANLSRARLHARLRSRVGASEDDEHADSEILRHARDARLEEGHAARRLHKQLCAKAVLIATCECSVHVLHGFDNWSGRASGHRPEEHLLKQR